jgi:hypothetical protein
MLVLGPLRKAEPVRRLLRRLIYGKNANYYYVRQSLRVEDRQSLKTADYS